MLNASKLAKSVASRRMVSLIKSSSFHSTSLALNASLLSGTKLAKEIRTDISAEVSSIQIRQPSFKPSLAIIQVGARPDSNAYVRMKLKAAEDSNIASNLIKFDETITEQELLNKIEELNNNPSVNGVLIQLPLPKHIDETKVTNSVSTNKDVDGFDRYNSGELAKRGGKPFFLPCTPNGCMRLLKESGVELQGKYAVVIGRSDIVGTPVAALLRNADCTVTICHRHTKNIADIVKQADIVVAACGIPNFVQGEWLKEDAVVIDVGINYIADPTKKSGQKLVGDVDFESASRKASFITPVPGGVGPMTVAMLCSNVYQAAKQQFKEQHSQPKITTLPLVCQTPVPSDIAISRAQTPRHISDLAKEMGVLNSELEPFGHYKAKISLELYDRLQNREDGYYVLVAGITPTPLGEGKSTTTMGLVQSLGAHLGLPAIANVRQPSMGPTFGVKGGAAGGGYAQVIPMDEFNMHLTGDIHAIGAANNLLAAAIDTRMFHEATQKDGPLYKRLVPVKKGGRSFTPSMLKRLEKLGITKTDPNELTEEEASKFARLDLDPESITLKRVLDVNDRFVREVTVGQAPTEKGFTRRTGFDITVASELMAILALSRDLKDLRQRVGRIVVGLNRAGEPITCEDIGCGGAITALLKDAIKPNLMQTLEGTPVLVHAGPFANISIGASSVIADRLGLKLAGVDHSLPVPQRKGFVVTEAGFDFTMGGERFFNIKCRASGLKPDTVVLVATVRALKLHGGAPDVKPGQSLPIEYTQESVELVRNGCANLAKQISNAKSYGVPVVVAINQFETDTAEEIEVIRQEALKAGATDAVPSNHWAKGGEGAIDLAHSVVKAVEVGNKDKKPTFLYDVDKSVEEKLSTIAQKMYGASGIELSEKAAAQIKAYEAQGFGNLPICIAKTQYSLSHDPKLKGVPTGFTVPIREVRISVGAGYLYALAAEIMTIPGLSTHAGYMNVEVNDKGEIEGLF